MGQSDLVLINKKRTCYLGNIAVLAEHSVEIEESEKERQISGSCQRTEKNVVHKG